MNKIIRKKSFWIIVIVILYQLQFYIFPVSLRYNNSGVKVNAVLSFEESKAIKKILKNSTYIGVSSSCGFGLNESITIGTLVYCVAQDGCETFRHNFLYYDISREDMAYIHSVFKKYGAKGFHS